MQNRSSPYHWIDKSLKTIHQANWYRSPKIIDSLAGAEIELEGQKLINFASNDYLGLAGDDRLIQAAITATQTYGTGSTGSRLLSGHRQLHRDLEIALANLKKTEDALVFSSGYLANLGTIAALVSDRQAGSFRDRAGGKADRDLILSDTYNHSSLRNGAKLSGARIIEYKHNDIDDLHQKIAEYRSQYRRCLIITDSVFSMDGDLCSLPQLLFLANKYELMLLIDEAHATGVMGKTGAGCVEHFHCTGAELVQIGTLSKALGSLGGYVAGSANLIDFLRNRASSWIYTTALSPADTAAALAAVGILTAEPERLQQLWYNVAYLKNKLSDIDLFSSESPIICIGLKNSKQALEASQMLKESGIFAPAIRPPTVPTSRIRLSVMATHQICHLDRAIASIAKLACKH
jgi:8-amino-7-oxononanoate synthase